MAKKSAAREKEKIPFRGIIEDLEEEECAMLPNTKAEMDEHAYYYEGSFAPCTKNTAEKGSARRA